MESLESLELVVCRELPELLVFVVLPVFQALVESLAQPVLAAYQVRPGQLALVVSPAPLAALEPAE